MKKIIFAVAALAFAANAAQWDYPANAQQIFDSEGAKAYLQQYYAELGSYKFRYKTVSKTGSHYNFDIWQNDEYQPQKTMVVSTDNSGQIVRIFKSLENTIIRDGKPTIAAELESPRTLVAEFPPASDEQINAQVQVFSPDLRTMQQVPAPASLWKTLAEYPNAPEYLSKNIELQKMGEHYYLANSRLQQVDAKSLQWKDKDTGKVVTDSSMFADPEGLAKFSSLDELAQVAMTDLQFPQVMAFYHLDQSLQYLENLGYKLFSSPVNFDGRGQSIDNSAWFKEPQLAVFGTGGVSADAADADVVVHELGHGIHYQIVPDWAYGHAGALGEGIGDYWAGSYSYRLQFADANRQGQEFELDKVFNWDGHFGFRETHRSLNNTKAVYYESAEYPAHVSVGGELGDELWSTPLFQSLKQAVAQYGEIAFAEFDTLFLEGMYGVGRGVKMHDLAESTIFAAKTLYPQKDYAAILQTNFAKRGLIKPPFMVEYSSQYVDVGKDLTLHLAPLERQPNVNGTWQLGEQTLSLSITAPFTQKQFAMPINTALCGQNVSSNINAELVYAEHLLPQQWQHQQSIIAGLPVLLNKPNQTASNIPDAKLDTWGNEVAGSKIYSFTLNSAGVVDDSFAVFLDLQHERIVDLTIKLTSPRGTQVILLQHKSSAQTELKDFFTFAHNPQLAELAGESTKGTWFLEIIDSAHQKTGTLNSWGVSHFERYSCEAEPELPKSSGGAFSFASLLIFICGLWLKASNRKYFFKSK